MARLTMQNQGHEGRSLELRLGAKRVGRDPENDFPIEHPTVSTHHCEFILSGDGVVLHDLDSTNGSFVNGQQVTNIWLETGQTVRLGDVELLVDTTEVTVAIPKIEREVPVIKPPVQLENGVLVCSRHEHL